MHRIKNTMANIQPTDPFYERSEAFLKQHHEESRPQFLKLQDMSTKC